MCKCQGCKSVLKNLIKNWICSVENWEVAFHLLLNIFTYKEAVIWCWNSRDTEHVGTQSNYADLIRFNNADLVWRRLLGKGLVATCAELKAEREVMGCFWETLQWIILSYMDTCLPLAGAMALRGVFPLIRLISDHWHSSGYSCEHKAGILRSQVDTVISF